MISATTSLSATHTYPSRLSRPFALAINKFVTISIFM
nr:MAG TPA: hypothetical protein [Caudoviricetes sp.]